MYLITDRNNIDNRTAQPDNLPELNILSQFFSTFITALSPCNSTLMT